MNLLAVELYKIFTKPRSYLGFVAIGLIIVLIEFALYLDGRSYLQFIFQSMAQTFEIHGEILNGHLVAFIILQTLIVQMPLLVALVTGDAISGEASGGTLRLMLTHPVSRSRFLWAKYIAGSIYTVALIVWLGILALVVGRFIFGPGDLVVLKSEELVILRSADVVWRFGVAFLIAILSLNVVCALSMMLSSFTDNSVTPIVATMAVIIIFTIIGTIEVPLFDLIKPFLFTTHMIVWRSMFDPIIDMQMVLRSLAVLGAHIALFMGVTFYYFNRKDILS